MILLCLLPALAGVGQANEPLPTERPQEAPVTEERLPEAFEPLNEQELSRTRGVVNAPAALSPETSGEGTLHPDDELRQQQQVDQAALILELDSRIEDTVQALRGASEEQRPALEQRFENLSTLRQGF